MAQQSSIDLKWVYVGQYNPYGDIYRVCELHTKDILDEDTILNLVGDNNKLRKDIFFDRGDQLTMGEFFTGYYTIEKTEYGYKYTGVEPYDD